MSHIPRVPSYRRHSSGQARVTLDGTDHLIGPYKSAASHEAYRRLIAEWFENRSRPAKSAQYPLSVNELILAYWKFATEYYGFNTCDRGDYYCLRDALRILKQLYGRVPARDFGPLALKACRREMLGKDWARTYINAQIDRIRRVFRWAAEEELLPASVYMNLKAVSGLRRGKSTARETARVGPVPQEQIDVILPHLQPTVRAMVRLELLTGCRPAEVCVVRPIDIDRTDPLCWIYRPGSDQQPNGMHKTSHLGHDRMIFIGPRGQEVIRPYLEVGPGGSASVRQHLRLVGTLSDAKQVMRLSAEVVNGTRNP